VGSEWPDGWVTATLIDAGLPVSDFTRSVISAWAASTPILPYTNNPLGMPNVPGTTGQLMTTGYAMFVTMPVFRAAFSQWVNSPAGRQVREALALSEKYAPAWRAIHALPWPASKTETDWPSAVLDLTSESVRKRLATLADPSQRKTSGAYGVQTALGTQQGASERTGFQTAARAIDAARSVRINWRGY
jgi:hypothetical protein